MLGLLCSFGFLEIVFERYGLKINVILMIFIVK